MEKQELSAVQELYNLVYQWQEKYYENSVNMTYPMKAFYSGVQWLIKSLKILSDTEHIPDKTIEEKVVDAFFYVDGKGTQYFVEYYSLDDRTISLSDSFGNEYEIHFDSIPADAYFLGAIRL